MTTTVPPITATTTVDRLIQSAYVSDTDAVADAAIRAGLLWRCECRAINAMPLKACNSCENKRRWVRDVNPGAYDAKLLNDLRYALADHFDDRPYMARPAAVSFRTTHYDDGPAWSNGGARLHYTDKRQGVPYEPRFEGTFVADALTELSEDDAPESGAVLRVVVPAWGASPEWGTVGRTLDPPPHPLIGEYEYPISDYAREAAQVLGDGWDSESGYIGAYGLIWGPGVPTLRLYVDHDDDLMLQLKDDDDPEPHIVPLPNGAPTDADELRAVAEDIARIARTYLP